MSHYESHSGGAVRTLNAVGGHGFDARYIRGDVSAWYAAGGPRALRSVAS